ncbi:putative Isoamyl acetate-hydrolyzing esterase [Zostera marina]|uniref:Putative Isoamyl acetate-hydrolyzing esterase n=1 Tax=Zostera marina TaxID=29655 RepID=A0A0K9NT01_ZOSMR|nr:putative Isoamyl acetate-hydrolyzing esterase [Zostera marina]
MRPKVILFGDSITEMAFKNEGWSSCLANHFCRKVDVVLRGYSGYNTRWALKMVDKVFDGIKLGEAVAVVVFFGANDASLADRSSSFQHVPIPEYKTNLKAIISYIKEKISSTAVIVLITPPPIDEDGRIKNPYGENTTGLPERTNSDAGAYAEACKSVAMENNLPVLDIWSKMQEFPHWEKTFLSDGLHLTGEGNKIVFEELVSKLMEQGISIETLPIDLPHFSDIDPLDPLKSFI